MKRKNLAIIVIVVTILLTVTLTLIKGDMTNITSVEKLGQTLGAMSLIPTLLAVILAFITNNVLFSLLIGFLSGVLLLALVASNTLTSLPIAFIGKAIISIKEVALDIDNIKILVMCLLLGGTMNIAKKSGGFKAMAVKLKGIVNSQRSAGLFASLLGCLIFFDDYANSLAIGPIMKPIMHRVKLSREKLAFIINATSAPIAGIAIISSWVAVENSSIQHGFNILGINENCFSLLLKSLPYCFYCYLIVIFVFLNSLIGKDFGPMLKAEIDARYNEKEHKVIEDKENEETLSKRIFVGIGTIILLALITVASFYFFGKKVAIAAGAINNNDPLSLTKIVDAISYADTTSIICAASIVATIFASISGCIYKLFTIKEVAKAWLDGVRDILDTVILLLFAWCLANVVKHLGAVYYAIEIISMNVAWQLIPALIFISCCVISFASGSFGCMYVVMPLAIPLAYKMIAIGVTNPNEYLLICIGSVIAGSIFGDNSSPIADCTFLSAESAGIDPIDHTNSQLPYTLSICGISIVSIILVSIGMNVALVFLLAITFQILELLLIGKKPI